MFLLFGCAAERVPQIPKPQEPQSPRISKSGPTQQSFLWKIKTIIHVNKHCLTRKRYNMRRPALGRLVLQGLEHLPADAEAEELEDHAEPQVRRRCQVAARNVHSGRVTFRQQKSINTHLSCRLRHAGTQIARARAAPIEAVQARGQPEKEYVSIIYSGFGYYLSRRLKYR